MFRHKKLFQDNTMSSVKLWWDLYFAFIHFENILTIKLLSKPDKGHTLVLNWLLIWDTFEQNLCIECLKKSILKTKSDAEAAVWTTKACIPVEQRTEKCRIQVCKGILSLDAVTLQILT